MPDAPGAALRLPANPSREHLRKTAKRLARAEGVRLAEAQRRLAAGYGFRDWTELMRAAQDARGRSPIFAAAAAGDVEAVARLLAEGAPVDGSPEDPGPPLWAACGSSAPLADRLEVAERLIDAGAVVQSDAAGETALHAAARRGPLEMVEALIARGALEWAPDRRQRPPIAAARAGQAADRDAIVELLHRPVIRDPVFRAAVAAIHAGDAAALADLLDAHPRLLTERIVEPECYRKAGRFQYFLDPKLFWFVAGNPDLVVPMPSGMVDCARTMIAHGVGRADLDYTLELVMTSGPAAKAGLVAPLMAVLLDAGAQATEHAVIVTLAHLLTAPVEALLAGGHPMTASTSAGLGRLEDLRRLLPSASAEARQTAFGVAVINRRHAAARLCLEAGADVDGFLPAHSHSTALHQAAIADDIALLQMLVDYGARDDIADTLWKSTALGWATHQDKPAARAFLERLAAERRPLG
jgi:ankyrin repeat protein